MPERCISLRVRARLQTGAVVDAFCPLDGVVYYTLVRERLGPQDVTVPGAHRNEAKVGGLMPQMPFAALNNHVPGGHYFACSFAQWGPHADGVEHWTKRLDIGAAMDLVDFGGRRGTVAIGSGRYKAYRMPVFYRHALHVDWYCRGRPNELRALLRFCTHLGKKASQGWGAVLDWQVEPWHEDWSVTGPDGRLMRAVPDPGGEHIYGIRPSYWNPRHQTRVRLPEVA